MELFHPSILPDPLSLYTLTSATLKGKIIKGGAKIHTYFKGAQNLYAFLLACWKFSGKGGTQIFMTLLNTSAQVTILLRPVGGKGI